MKVRSLLSSMTPIKLFTIAIGVVWVGIGSTIIGNLFLNAYSNVSPFFLYSAALQLFITFIALLIYVYQLVLIQQVDISEPIVGTQKKLAGLKSSTLLCTRILFLQLPLWTTFFWPSNMFTTADTSFMIINVIIALLFSFAAYWLFNNISYHNRDKKWFRMIFTGREWTPVLKSMELYKEIEDYSSTKR